MTLAARLTPALLALLALVLLATSPTRATVQEEDCIDPAVEYPVPCDDGD